MADIIYKTKEIADKLKVTPMTITRYIKSGKLEAFRVGNEWRITQNALLNFIEKETNKGVGK